MSRRLRRLRIRSVAVIMLISAFPFAALGWFSPQEVVALTATVATVITSVIRPFPEPPPDEGNHRQDDLS